jgi:microcystin degradation protein MlrC
MRELIDRGCALEDANDVCVVSVCAGFSAADIHDIGPSVTVTVDVMQDETAALSRAQAVADEFTDYAWQQRAYSSVNHIDVPSAIALALEEQADRKHDHGPPLILAEVTDNPGSGHYGDAVNLLKAMVGSGDDEPGLSNAALYAIFDPEAVQAGIAIGEGNEGSITMGGRHDTSAGGEPLTLFGKVLRITDGTCSARGPMAAHVACSGPSMAFRCRGVDIAVISNNGQPYDVAQLEALGIDFKSKTTVALKSNHHFRASFEPLARRVVTVDGGGLGHTILFGGSYKHVRRPIWPLDDIPL